MSKRKSFPPGVVEGIKSYVYMLLDPRVTPAEPFYVGKGESNRIFAHLHEALNSPKENLKLGTIREIHAAGLEVKHVILRHGLGRECAEELEAAFIDFMENLTNIAGGYRSRTRGLMTIDDVIAEYEAPDVTISEPAILIKINRLFRRGMSQGELYEATRSSWKMTQRRNRAQFAFSVALGIIRQVYRIEGWEPAEDNPKRWAFRGAVDPEMAHYIGGSVAKCFVPGEAWPIKYLNCD